MEIVIQILLGSVLLSGICLSVFKWLKCHHGQCKLDALQNRCDQKMSTPSTEGSDNTDMKRRSQSNRSVDTISTYSQQSTVCSPVILEPLGSLPSIPLPTVLPVSYNMHVPPEVNVSVAHSTSQGRAPMHSYQNRTAGTHESKFGKF